MPLAEHGAGADGAGRILTSSIAGGEGPVGERQEEGEPYPLVVRVGLGVAGGGSPAWSRAGGRWRTAALGGCERVGELRHGERKLTAGSTRAKRGRRWGLRGEPELCGSNSGGGGCLGAGDELVPGSRGKWREWRARAPRRNKWGRSGQGRSEARWWLAGQCEVELLSSSREGRR
jgi:hypothetical protein